MKHYTQDAEAVFSDLRSSAQGLSSAEASSRLAKHGKNKLAEAKKVPLIKRFFEQLCDPMLIILLVAAAISGVTSIIE